MSGQSVEMFDRDFRELYAISRELNLFKEFSINKSRTAASTRVTVPTRPALPATSRFQVSLGDKGTLKVPAHKYHNPKYLLALGGLPEDISTPEDLIKKMEESISKFAAEGNPVDEDNEEVMESQTPPLSQKGEKSTKLSCFPSKKEKKYFWRKSKQNRAGKNEGVESGEAEPGPSTTTKLTPTTGTIEGITADTTPTSKETKSKKKNKKSKLPPSEDQGMFMITKSKTYVNVHSFSLDFGLIMMVGNY